MELAMIGLERMAANMVRAAMRRTPMIGRELPHDRLQL